ncbi:MAG: GIY-YIG nuclease family protein [bacterium]|nr:GIY-YIG nuclease family protein [bacterium]
MSEGRRGEKGFEDERIKGAPRGSGVYVMKDGQARVLYVGKAKNLRARILSYFRPGADGRPNVAFLGSKVAEIEYVTTPTEEEAALLENQLIKEYQPRYNFELKDDRRYFSLKVTIQEEFPRLLVTHQRVDDGSLYFGPFPRGVHVKRLARVLQKKYGLRRCGGASCRRRGECMYAQIGGCSAPCSGKVSREEYHVRVEGLIEELRRIEAMNVVEDE